MNSKHLSAGDPCPPLIPGSLRIYNMRFCPYAQRVLLVAAAKGIQYDVVNINLITKPEFIFLRNPDGKVPTIESEDGLVLYESLIASDYMDEADTLNKCRAGGDATSRKLNPEDPYKKALDRIWIEKFSKISTLDFKLYINKELQSDEVLSLMKQLNDELTVFENELQRRGTKFFSGPKPGMLDYMIWPWMERLPCLELINKNEAHVLHEGRASRPTLTAWEQAMVQDDAVKESYLPPDVHMKYRQMRRGESKLNYDFLHQPLS